MNPKRAARKRARAGCLWNVFGVNADKSLVFQSAFICRVAFLASRLDMFSQLLREKRKRFTAREGGFGHSAARKLIIS